MKVKFPSKILEREDKRFTDEAVRFIKKAGKSPVIVEYFVLRGSSIKWSADEVESFAKKSDNSSQREDDAKSEETGNSENAEDENNGDNTDTQQS